MYDEFLLLSVYPLDFSFLSFFAYEFIYYLYVFILTQHLLKKPMASTLLFFSSCQTCGTAKLISDLRNIFTEILLIDK